MVTLCVFSKADSNALLKALLCVFRGKKVLLCREGISAPPSIKEGQTDLLILENPAFPVSETDPCLFLLREYADPLPAVKNSVAVADSADDRSLLLLQSAGMRTVTCGFLSKDVFTLSGVGEDCLTVSLQRSIPSLFGNLLEPRDVIFRCDLAQKEQQSALLAVSAGILCERL